MRLFVADSHTWTELTEGRAPTVRISAPDLAAARRKRAGIRSEDDTVSVILDVVVAVAGDYRTARRGLEAAGADAAVRYVGTADGLAGLIADISSAGVADGVTLLAGTPDQEIRILGSDVLHRLQLRDHARRAS